jgi:hypothetical protein
MRPSTSPVRAVLSCASSTRSPRLAEQPRDTRVGSEDYVEGAFPPLLYYYHGRRLELSAYPRIIGICSCVAVPLTLNSALLIGVMRINIVTCIARQRRDKHLLA